MENESQRIQVDPCNIHYMKRNVPPGPYKQCATPPGRWCQVSWGTPWLETYLSAGEFRKLWQKMMPGILAYTLTGDIPVCRWIPQTLTEDDVRYLGVHLDRRHTCLQVNSANSDRRCQVSWATPWQETYLSAGEFRKLSDTIIKCAATEQATITWAKTCSTYFTVPVQVPCSANMTVLAVSVIAEMMLCPVEIQRQLL
jgi:hypothetical protein